VDIDGAFGVLHSPTQTLYRFSRHQPTMS